MAGNSVDLLPGYDGALAAMTEAVEGATRYVNMQFHITAWDDAIGPFFTALVRATERGVRLLFDHLGSRGLPTHKQTLTRLGATTIEWQRMML